MRNPLVRDKLSAEQTIRSGKVQTIMAESDSNPNEKTKGRSASAKATDSNEAPVENTASVDAGSEDASANSSESTTVEITRTEAANRITSKYTGWAAGGGAIPVPIVDIAAIASVQTLMMKELFELYETPFSEAKARTVVSVLIGSLSPKVFASAVAVTFMKFIPGVGHLAAIMTQAILASAFSYAVGKVTISHLEGGGSLDNFNIDKGKFKQYFEDGKKRFSEDKEKLKEKFSRKQAEPAPAETEATA